MSWPGVARKFLPRTALELLDGASVARRRKRNVAVMFVDIEGCTRLCEDLPAEEMGRVIKRYFSRYLDVIHEAGGEMTEVLGDGLVALFQGASLAESTAWAVQAAVRIREWTAELNTREAGRHDAVVVNIGLNAGPGSVGIMRLRGKSGERWVYTASGPVTNIAARLCALATGGQILVSGTAAEHMRERSPLRALGPRALKNVSAPVQVFEVLTVRGSRESRSIAARGKARAPQDAPAPRPSGAARPETAPLS